MIAKRIATMTALLMLVLTALPVTALAEDNPNDGTGPGEDRASYITTDRGSTDMFGGGDYYYIRFGNDASFGLIYGTEENPNSIVIIAKHTRFIGLANVKEDTGKEYEKPVPLFVQTIVAQKLEDLFEFNDTNGDGIASYRKTGNGLRYDDYPQHEPIYKRVSLDTAWTSEVSTEKEITEDGIKKKTWIVTLTAENLTYRGIDVDPNSTERLEKLEFTFYLTASLVKVDNVTIPQYDVTIHRGKVLTTIIDSNRIENRTYSGQRGAYSVKYDHLIQGWDFYEKNENPHLLLEFHMIVGNYVPPQTAKWMKHEFMQQQGRVGTAQFESGNGTESITEDDSVDEDKPVKNLPKRIRGGRIRLDDDWESIGRLTWVSNVTVDGEEKEMYAQIQGGKKINVKGPYGGVFSGFAVLGGFSYPGGDSIFHDPEMSSSMFLASTAEDTETTSGAPIGVMILVGVVAVGAIAAVAVVARKPHPPANPYERSLDMPYPRENKVNPQPDWEEFLKR